jgi:preprotein translocase subunit SecG
MYIAVLLIHILVCIFLIIVVLLQSGKAADLAGAFGGMGSQTAFGPRGSATLLSKATTISAVLFMLTSLTLSILATKNAGLATTVLQGQTNTSKTQKSPAPPASAPAPKPVPGQPQTQTGGDGTVYPLPSPQPAPKK